VRSICHRDGFKMFTKCRLIVLAGVGLVISALPVHGQALPAAEASPISTGFVLPTTSGTLSYSLTASENLNWGFYSNSGRSAGTSMSGNLGFISTSKRSPFSAVLAAGHSFSNSNQPSYDFVGLGLSQVISMRRWNFVLADNASYLPQTPANGYAGIPGLGDLNVLGSSGISLGLIPTSVIAPPTQGILTRYESRVDNTASGTVQRDFTGKTGIHGSASYSIARYTDQTGNPLNDGLDSDGISGGGGINHMYSQRNIVGANFTYSSYSFLQGKTNLPVSDFNSQTASVNYLHEFSRRLQGSLAVGPQWTTIDLGNRSTSLSAFASLSLSYAAERVRHSLSFVRSTNSGYGVIGGALSNSVGYSASGQFSRVWAVSGAASYSRSTSLPTPFLPGYVFNTSAVTGQISRALPHSLSAFASYSLQSQTDGGALLSILNAFSGHYQTLGLGITYSPRPKHFGGH
jgi:hypothetical protein